MVAQTAKSNRSVEPNCEFKGCRSYSQLARTNDPDANAADVVCFYDGDNPASKDKDTPTTDEFFLLMNGKKGETISGVHPGVFVNVVKDGLPEGYFGYGPEHGGIGESDAVKNESLSDGRKVGLAHTYDDLDENIRFAYFFFGQQTFWNGKEYKLIDEPRLRQYDETVVRKSTGRFVRTLTDFDSRIVDDSWIPQPGPWYVKYTGQCFMVRQASLKAGIPGFYK